MTRRGDDAAVLCEQRQGVELRDERELVALEVLHELGERGCAGRTLERRHPR